VSLRAGKWKRRWTRYSQLNRPNSKTQTESNAAAIESRQDFDELRAPIWNAVICFEFVARRATESATKIGIIREPFDGVRPGIRRIGQKASASRDNHRLVDAERICEHGQTRRHVLQDFEPAFASAP